MRLDSLSEGEIAPEDIRTPIAFSGIVLPRDVEILQIEKVLVEPPVLRRLDGAAQRSGLAQLDAFAAALDAAAETDERPSLDALVRRLGADFPGLDPRDIARALTSADPRRLGAAMSQVGVAMVSEGVADMLPPGAYSRVAVLDGVTEVTRELASITQQSRLVEVLTARLRDTGPAARRRRYGRRRCCASSSRRT